MHQGHRAILGRGGAGLGNQLWNAAIAITLAAWSNRTAFVPCGSCYRDVAFGNMLCYSGTGKWPKKSKLQPKLTPTTTVWSKLQVTFALVHVALVAQELVLRLVCSRSAKLLV